MVASVYSNWLDLIMQAYPVTDLEERKMVLLLPGVDKKDARNCQIALHKKFKATYSDVMPNHQIKMEATPEGWKYWIQEVPPSRLTQFHESTKPHEQETL